MIRNRLALVVAVLVPLVLLATGSGGATPTGVQANLAVSGKVSIVGVWTGPQQKNFQAVLDAFKKKFPNVKVSYQAAGDNVPTVLSTAVAGGNPPDLASVAQPALVESFVKQKKLKPLTFALKTAKANYSPDFIKLGTYNGKFYGLLIKAANKSTVWYNVKAFKNAGVKAPKDWPAFMKNAKTLKASGTPAYSIGGADGWTLTDLFENIYLRQAGPAKYDQLTLHKIKWTDASVKSALKTMGQILGDTSNIFGGKSGALQTDFPTSVNNVFATPAKAAQVIEGDFVPGVATVKSKPGSGYNEFAFPTIGSSGQAVVGGGDTLIMFKDTPASRALVSYMATPQAVTIWAKRGGFSSPNKNVPSSAYPDALTRTIATTLANAKTFRFDLSDLQPPSFGATVGKGEFKIFQDFLRNPKNVNGIASSLESAAAAAFKKGK
jgi:hypothetical protein